MGFQTSNPTAVLFQTIEGMGIKLSIVKFNVIQIAENISLSSDSFTKKSVEFVKQLSISKESKVALEKLTRGQSNNVKWIESRKGRITASNFYRVFTKVNSLKTKQNIDSTSLVDSLMGKTKPPQTTAMKHGKAMESHAKRKYLSIVKKKHTNFSLKDIELVLFKNHPYIGASPDGYITCNCCQSGVLEIKCPHSIIEYSPSADNLAYLTENTDEDKTKSINLKQNTAYYYQILGQMAATKTMYCDFFVFTKHGYFLERILFDEAKWNKAMDNLTWF